MSGFEGSISLGKQAAFGTGVVPETFFPGTESITRNREILRDENPYGSYDELPGDTVGSDSSGQISCQAYPNALGALLYAALGSVTTVAEGDKWRHTFKRAAAAVSSIQARPAYSATAKKGPLILRHVDGQLNQLALNAQGRARVTTQSDWMFRTVEEISGPLVPTLDLSAFPFSFKHASHERDGVSFKGIENVSLTINNGITATPRQDGTDGIGDFELGRHMLDITMALNGKDRTVYDDFHNVNKVPWTFKWVAGDYELAFNILKLNIESDPQPPLSAGVLQSSANAKAELDVAAGHAYTVELVNDTESYTL